MKKLRDECRSKYLISQTRIFTRKPGHLPNCVC